MNPRSGVLSLFCFYGSSFHNSLTLGALDFLEEIWVLPVFLPVFLFLFVCLFVLSASLSFPTNFTLSMLMLDS